MRSSGRLTTETTKPIESKDGKSILKFVCLQEKKKSAKKDVKTHRKKVTLVVGFPGAGLVGSISANYLIEKMNLRQVAFVDSDYVLPTIIYIGGRLRHPFRIYSNKERTLYIMVCEAPVMPVGINSIMDLIATWALRYDIGEVIVLDGIASPGLPAFDRTPEILRSNFTDEVDIALASSKKPHQADDSSVDLKEKPKVRSAVIAGLSAGVLEACLSSNIACTGILIPTTSGVPDPEGAAILLETISKIPNVHIEVDVGPLRREGEEIKKQLATFIAELRAQQLEGRTSEERNGSSPYLGKPAIYG